MKVKKGDNVMVMVGKDRGKTGKIERVYLKTDKVLVLGVNLFKKHMKKRGEDQKGQIVDVPRPLHVSNVSLVCPKCKKPTRVRFLLDKNDKKRICCKCEAII